MRWHSSKQKGFGLSQEFDEANEAALTDPYWDKRTRRGNVIDVPDRVKRGGNGSTYYAGNTVYQSCGHKGEKVVYEAQGKCLYGASLSGINEFSGAWDLIIDLASVVRSNPDGFVKNNNPSKYDVLKKYTYAPARVKSEVLKLDWPDMNPPPASTDFWVALWEMLPAKTVICCHGGHGRTGTCLASFMIVSGIDFYSAIETVRVEHCKKAIETQAQEEYLHALYVDMLKRRLVIAQEAKNNNEVKDLLIDITYAQNHPPVNGGTKTAGYLAASTKEDNKGKDVSVECEEGFRMVGDDIYVQECVSAICNKPGCNEASHQGWVKWDSIGNVWGY